MEIERNWHKKITERDELQCEEGPKSQISSTPPTAQTAWAIEPIFRLGVHQRHRIDVTVAIFDFRLEPPKTDHLGFGVLTPREP